MVTRILEAVERLPETEIPKDIECYEVEPRPTVIYQSSILEARL